MSSYRLLPKLHLYSYRKCPNSSPLLTEEGWLRSKKMSRSSLAAQTAGGARASPIGRSHQRKVVGYEPNFKTHFETWLVSDHPVRDLSERGHLLDVASTPPP